MSELDDLADAAGYVNFGKLSNAVFNNVPVNAATFGDYTVSFGGYDWFPVLAEASGNDFILTLWLKTSVGNYSFTDGTYSNVATSPCCGDYQYSWIRAAINRGQTTEGCYYGSWSASSTSYTTYQNGSKSGTASCAPTAFPHFSSIVGNSYVVLGGDYNDYLWLPSMYEVQSGGSWGCTKTQWAGLTTNLRFRDTANFSGAWLMEPSGNISYNRADVAYATRPAVKVKISDVTTPAEDKLTITESYSGNNISFPFVYDPTYVDIKIDATDPNGDPLTTVSTADIYNNSFNATVPGTYKIKIELKSTDMQWRDSTGGSDPRNYTFTISRKTINYTLSDPTMTYDGTTAATVTANYTGVLSQDNGTANGPDVKIYYKSTDNWGYGTAGDSNGNTDDSGKGYGSLNAPTQAGHYLATLIDVNEKTSYYTMSGSNTVAFEIKPIEFTVPDYSATAPTYYNAKEQPFQITGTFNATYMDIVRNGTGFTLTGNTYSDGVTWDPANNRITATNAGNYEFVYSLKDTRNTCWKSTGSTYDYADKTVSLEIKPFDLSNSISVDGAKSTGNTGNSWPLGDTGALVLKLSALGSDSVTVYMDYCKSGTTSAITAGIDNGTLTLDTSKVTPVGNYTLRVRLQKSSDGNYSADNANYTISGEYWTFDFVIGAGSANVKLNWTYAYNGILATDLFDSAGQQVTLTYNGKAYTIDAKVDSSTSYAQIDTTARAGYVNGFYTVRQDGGTCDMTAAGVYVTRVALVVDSSHEFDTAYRFNANDGLHGWVEIVWEITQCELDFDNAEWEYSYDLTKWYDFANGDPEYDAGGVYVRIKESYLKGLGLDPADPNSVELNYTGGNFGGNKNYEWFLSPKGTGYYVYAEITVNDGNYTTVSGSAVQKTQHEFDITAQVITVTWSATGLSFSTLDGISETYGISKAVDRNGNDCSNLFTYVFEFTDNDTGNTLSLNEADARAFFEKNASNTKTYTGTVTAVLNNPASYEFKGSNSHDFSVGKSLPTIIVTIGGSGSQYEKVVFTFEATYGTGTSVNHYEQYLSVSVYAYDDYYNGGNPLITKTGSEAAQIQELLNKQPAGDYIIEVVAVAGTPAANFVVKKDVNDFTIVPQEVVIPVLINTDRLVYKASDYNIVDYLDGFNSSLMELDGQHSDVSGKTAKDYTVTVNLKDPVNYIFVYPDNSGASGSKLLMRAVLCDDTVSSNSVISPDGSSVDIGWTIQKFVITDSMFNTSTGALNLPEQFNEILQNEQLKIGYTYYTDKTGGEEITELKKGESYYVVASLGGDCASNFVFENPSANSETVSTRVAFKTPQSGLNAAWGKAMDFFKGEGPLGLPVWAWFLIGLALLILLIIIIVVASKRRKNKQERLAKKEAKEEEKRRREEERQMQKEKLEAERELAKAKQEAELEKIRAQAGLGMGAASMAMQQPVQQQMPIPQQQPVQMPVQQQMPQYQQPVPQYQQMPMAMPQQMPVMMPQYQQPQGGDNSRIAQLEMEVAKIKAESEIRSTGVDERLKTAYFAHPNSMPAPVERVEAQDKKGMTAELLGEAILSALSKLMDKTPEHPQATEDGKAYPPDAVVTTTTTVDTTKNKPVARSREEQNFDVDGFYDKYE